MNTNISDNDRIEKFTAAVGGAQKQTSGNAAAEKAASTLGVVLMIVGIVLAIGMYVTATNEGIGKGTAEEILLAQMNQNQEMILAIAGVGLIFLGAVLYLRTALVRFWRFWMLRSLYETRSNLDEIVEAIKQR